MQAWGQWLRGLRDQPPLSLWVPWGGWGSLTLGCPFLADLVSCLVRGTHYTQEHVR